MIFYLGKHRFVPVLVRGEKTVREFPNLLGISTYNQNRVSQKSEPEERKNRSSFTETISSPQANEAKKVSKFSLKKIFAQGGVGTALKYSN